MTQQDDLTRQALRGAVAQICLAVGWTSIHSNPLEILVDILDRYMTRICQQSQSHAEIFGRTEGNIEDIDMTFESLGIRLSDLEEFLQFSDLGPPKPVAPYPAPSVNDLNHLKPGSKEVLHRPVHVHDHLPPMYPDMEEEATTPNETDKFEEKSAAILGTPNRPTKKEAGGANDTGQQENDGCPLRELSSVMMTSSGFLSPCREGKLPESRTPQGHVQAEAEERKGSSVKRYLDGVKKIEIKEEPVRIKEEVLDLSEKKFIPPEQKYKKIPKKLESQMEFRDIKPIMSSPAKIDAVLEAVIQRGVRESENYPEPFYSDGDYVEDESPPRQPVMKTPEKKERKKRKPNKVKVHEEPLLFSHPSSSSNSMMAAAKNLAAHAAAAKTLAAAAAAKNMAAQAAQKKQQQKVMESVHLPAPGSFGLPGMMGFGGGNPLIPGGNPLIPGGNPLIPGGNPLIPQFPMGLYGFGGVPASLIPGFNPALAMQNPFLHQNLLNQGLDDDPECIDIDDEEMEEGQIAEPSPPPKKANSRKDSKPKKVEQRVSPEVEIIECPPGKRVKEDLRRREEERSREREKEKEREREREREKEKEREKLREREERDREKERERIKEREREREKEKERERERERDREREREREKEREKLREAEKEKEKEREREKEIEKERLKAEKAREKESEKEKKKAKKDKKEKERDKEKEKKKEKKDKPKKEKKKSKDRKEKVFDEPALFAPEGLKLKIKPVTPAAKPPSIPRSTPITKPTPPPADPPTPKLVIKNLPKEPQVPEEEPIPLLTFQPMKVGPTRTPRTPKAEKTPKAKKTPVQKPALVKTPVQKPALVKTPVQKPALVKTPVQKPATVVRPAAVTAMAGPSGVVKKETKKDKKIKSKEIVEDDDDDVVEGSGFGIVTETVGSYTDDAGNKVWICPACGKQDDGTPMIGCDKCDDWYHWLCVGINSEPGDKQDWYCTRCIAKKQGLYLDRKNVNKKPPRVKK